MKLLGCSVCKRMLPRKVFSSSQLGKQGMVGQLMKNFAKQAIKKKGKLLFLEKMFLAVQLDFS